MHKKLNVYPQSRITAYCITINRKLGWGSPEPQPESGYPHLHAGFFTKFTNDEKDRLKNHLSRVVKAGDFKHALDFSFEQNFNNGEVESLRNYIMKYLMKTFVETIPDWTPEKLVFNALHGKKVIGF